MKMQKMPFSMKMKMKMMKMPRQSRKAKKAAASGPIMPYNLRKRVSSKMEEMKKEKGVWDDIRCPICLDHPHKAILLICSKGCLPYVCDTDYILTYCFNKLCDSQSVERPPKKTPDGKRQTRFHFPADQRRPTCPVCHQGEVTGWIVEERARKAMDAYERTCKVESCGISGDYADFKDHARLLHDRSNYDVWHDQYAESDHSSEDEPVLWNQYNPVESV